MNDKYYKKYLKYKNKYLKLMNKQFGGEVKCQRRWQCGNEKVWDFNEEYFKKHCTNQKIFIAWGNNCEKERAEEIKKLAEQAAQEKAAKAAQEEAAKAAQAAEEAKKAEKAEEAEKEAEKEAKEAKEAKKAAEAEAVANAEKAKAAKKAPKAEAAAAVAKKKVEEAQRKSEAAKKEKEEAERVVKESNAKYDDLAKTAESNRNALIKQVCSKNICSVDQLKTFLKLAENNRLSSIYLWGHKGGRYSLGLFLRILYLLVLDSKSETIDGELDPEIQTILQTKVTLEADQSDNDWTYDTDWEQGSELNVEIEKITEVIEDWTLNNKVDNALMFINLLILRRLLTTFQDKTDFLEGKTDFLEGKTDFLEETFKKVISEQLTKKDLKETFLALFDKKEGPGEIVAKVKTHRNWGNFYTSTNQEKIKKFWEAKTIAKLFEKYFNLLSDLKKNITNREIHQLALRLNEFLGISKFMEILQEELDYRKNNPKTREEIRK